MGKKNKKKFKGRNKHHLVPRSRGGHSLPNNRLLIKIDKHNYWHRIFGNMTLDEVIILLLRLRRAKRRT